MWLRILLLALVMGIAHAQQPYPSKPIKIVVPFPPGGPTDLTARVVSAHFTKAFGQPSVVENISGAGGLVGSDRVAKAAPDGYTVLMGSSNAFSVAQLLTKVPFDALKDFTLISLAIRTPNYLAINAKKLPTVNGVQDLIAYARQNPGKLTYSSSGNGTSPHMSMELFKSMTGLKILHVPYKGTAPGVTALVAGEVDMAMEVGANLIPLADSGKIKLLAATTAERTRAMPRIPTVAESGLPGFDAYTWYALAGPAGLSHEVVQKLHAETVRGLTPPDVRQKLEQVGAEVIASTPEAFAAFQKREIAKWTKLVKEAGIKAD